MTRSIDDQLDDLRAAGGKLVRHGAYEANRLGLSRQVPVREIWLTSGPSRQLASGKRVVDVRHAPQEMLRAGVEGQILRALVALGKSRSERWIRKMADAVRRGERISICEWR